MRYLKSFAPPHRRGRIACVRVCVCEMGLVLTWPTANLRGGCLKGEHGADLSGTASDVTDVSLHISVACPEQWSQLSH